MSKFSDWILDELRERDWSQADLARKSGLTRATISYYLGPKSKSPDENALRKIAKAFNLPVEFVFQKAGILPSNPEEDDPFIAEIIFITRELPPNDIQDLLDLARVKHARYARTTQSPTKP